MYISTNETNKDTSKNRNQTLIIIGSLIILLTITSYFLSSCSSNVEEPPYEYDEYIESDLEENQQPNNGESFEDYGNYTIPEHTEEDLHERIERERREFAESITREQIQEDFNYMMDVLEDNFPFFDLTIRRHGVDIREEAERFRGVLADESMPIDAKIFIELLNSDFINSIYWVGHLRTIDDSWYRMYMRDAINSPEYLWPAVVYERFTTYPSTSRFYGEVTVYDLEEMALPLEESLHDSNYYTFSIIEEGNIAQISISTLSFASYTDRENIIDFYEQIENYNHLIIDIRGNFGGWPNVFHELITVPHIRETIHLEVVSFYKGGEYNLSLLETVFASRFSEPWDVSIIERPPSHFCEETFIVTGGNIMGRDGEPLFVGTRYLPWEDIDALNYYAIGTMYTLYPPGLDDVRSNFHGQIWLLTDSFSASGSEHVVALFKQNDLAIIVGEQGRGVFMCSLLLSNYFALPNTGIVIRYDVGYPVCRLTGLPLEEGIPPHFYNRPGLDALQTTLELIAEGAYRE